MDRTALVAAARKAMTPEYLAGVRLRHGTGTGEEGDACLIQEERRILRDAALRIAPDLAGDYDPSTDACPPCTSPLCRDLGIQIQDTRDDWRRECVSLLPLLPGSRGSDALETRRLYRLLDWSVREAMPAMLDVLAESLTPHDAGLANQLRSHGSTLRAFSPIVDDASRKAASEKYDAIALDRDLARALALARARARALALARARALALDRALALALALALDLALDLALALARAIPSPVALLRELLEMTEENNNG